MDRSLRSDAIEISRGWLDEVDLASLIGPHFDNADRSRLFDVVAIGKAARQMSNGVRDVLGDRVQRELLVVSGDEQGPARSYANRREVVGDHPVPAEASLAAGQYLASFLDAPTTSNETVFLVSGGASSLCALPAPPLTMSDLAQVWVASLKAGLDITQLNRLRASTSLISGGCVLGRVRTASSRALIMVDNVISGPRWVASGLTYDYRPSAEQWGQLVGSLGVQDPELVKRLGLAFECRSRVMEGLVTASHTNEVLAEPGLMLGLAALDARQRGYDVISLGASVHGDVEDVVGEWTRVLRTLGDGPHCLIGVGEVTVRVGGAGRGGRCQEFAWRMAAELPQLGREAVFVARSSDGRDFIEGVAGAFVETRTRSRAEELGIDYEDVAQRHDTHGALEALDLLIDGSHTGWNLCDLYVAVLGASGS
ncbi:MAG: DUF4147 domain-containing protein [Acidimicrobiaceae bacterium]|nr:DUF4147 domain-containing protein [Acidimicrobiaceae bacterium]